jgi:hypothetical protein
VELALTHSSAAKEKLHGQLFCISRESSIFADDKDLTNKDGTEG